jgi:hypothetical protein
LHGKCCMESASDGREPRHESVVNTERNQTARVPPPSWRFSFLVRIVNLYMTLLVLTNTRHSAMITGNVTGNVCAEDSASSGNQDVPS